MVREVSLAAPYDFARLINTSRAIQIGCSVLQAVLVYSEAQYLGMFSFFWYIGLIVALSVHLVRRWYLQIDGRYDLKQLLREKNNTSRVQYAIALFSPILLGFLIYYCVLLQNGFVHYIFVFANFVQCAFALAQLLLEMYEVFFKAEPENNAKKA